MQKNQSKVFSYLSKITKDIGLLSIKSNQIDNNIKQLINYLANGKIKEEFWAQEKSYPKYIFIEQFSEQLLVVIYEKEILNKDEFIQPYIGQKKVLTFEELTL